jgi:transcription antitermination factor NusG
MRRKVCTLFNWYALYVRSRHEFVIRDQLFKKEIETYLPVVQRLRQWKDRKKQISFPLFPGYLFVNIPPDPENFLSVLKVKGVLNFVSAEPGYPTVVPTEEINSLMLLLENEKAIDVFPHIKEGTRVRVKRGPLQGAEGVLVKKDDQYMFLVNINILGRSVGVRIYADDVEVI